MSKEKQQDSVIDCVVVWSDGQPLYIRADSLRAKALFEQWGVTKEAVGILPPEDAFDFMESMPGHWLMGMDVEENINKEYLVQEIPLPQPRLVLH